MAGGLPGSARGAQEAAEERGRPMRVQQAEAEGAVELTELQAGRGEERPVACPAELGVPGAGLRAAEQAELEARRLGGQAGRLAASVGERQLGGLGE